MKITIDKRFIGLILISFATSGCGTIATRYFSTPSFGAYPYQAVGFDIGTIYGEVQMVSAPGSQTSNDALDLAFVFAVFLPSIPFDIVFDTIGLPIDLICWSNGSKKDYDWSH